MSVFRRLALSCFLLYLAVLPGSTITVALDRVPAWGEWMGGALLLLQGAAALGWLVGFGGRRGALAGLLVFLMAWGVEHLGVTTGFPFGRYRYTAMLQPQLLGVVPLPIVCAWLMVAAGAWQIAQVAGRRLGTRGLAQPALAATLVLLLDLQIETVATQINRYWVWLDGGPYYGVPTANFVAWWLAGLLMALVVGRVLPGRWAMGDRRWAMDGSSDGGRPTPAVFEMRIKDAVGFPSQPILHFTFYILHFTPAYLYLLSTLMFTVVNLARGYVAAGLVGAAVLVGAALWRAVPHQAHSLAQKAQGDS